MFIFYNGQIGKNIASHTFKLGTMQASQRLEIDFLFWIS